MEGRLERETIAYEKLNKKIKEMPDYVEDFSYAIRGGNQYTTVCLYVSYVCCFLRWLEEEEKVDIYDPLKLNDKKDSCVGKYLTYLKTSKGKKKATTASYRAVVWSALNSFYAYLLKNHYVNYNPILTQNRENPSKDLVKKDALTQNEITTIVQNIKNGVSEHHLARKDHALLKERDLLLFLILIDTAARISGILELNVTDFQIEERIVKITSKGNITKNYQLTDMTIGCLINWLKKREEIIKKHECEAVFITKQGNRLPYKSASNLIKKYSQGINKRVIPHTTRTTVATLVYNATGDIELVKDKLGHASTQTTSRYLCKGEEHIKRANQVGEQILRAALKM